MGILVFRILLIFAEVKISVTVVFTKYEHYRACRHISFLPDRRVEAINRAIRDFTKELEIPITPVSTQKKVQKENGGQLIISITILFLLN